MLVLTVGAGVYGFTYDSIVGEFILSHPDMKARAHKQRLGTWFTCPPWVPHSLPATEHNGKVTAPCSY